MFQVAFSKQFPFLLPLTCLLSLSVFENKPIILKNVSSLLTPLTSSPSIATLFVLKRSLCIFKKKKKVERTVGHRPAVAQMWQHMEAISGPGPLQSNVDCSLSSEPLKNRLATHSCSVWVWTDVLILCQLSQSIHNNVGLPHPAVLKNRSRGQCVKLSGPNPELEGEPQRRRVE